MWWVLFFNRISFGIHIYPYDHPNLTFEVFEHLEDGTNRTLSLFEVSSESYFCWCCVPVSPTGWIFLHAPAVLGPYWGRSYHAVGLKNVISSRYAVIIIGILISSRLLFHVGKHTGPYQENVENDQPVQRHSQAQHPFKKKKKNMGAEALSWWNHFRRFSLVFGLYTLVSASACRVSTYHYMAVLKIVNKHNTFCIP